MAEATKSEGDDLARGPPRYDWSPRAAIIPQNAESNPRPIRRMCSGCLQWAAQGSGEDSDRPHLPHSPLDKLLREWS